MKIALLTYSTKPRGGVVHTLALAETLATFGADVSVHALDRLGDRSFFRHVNSSVEIRLYPFDYVKDETVANHIVRSIDVMAASITSDDYDIVHAHDCISANAVPNCIRTVHHLNTFNTPELARYHRKAFINPSAHVCMTVAVADQLRQEWNIQATVIPSGVHTKRFVQAADNTSPAQTARRCWEQKIGGPYVLAVGGIEPRKGMLDLLEAVAWARRNQPDLELVVAGGESLFDHRDYRQQFDRSVAELNVTPIELGVVADSELPSLVASCDVFALSSTKESFGLAALEALAAGRPVVCRDLPVFREIFGKVPYYGNSGPTLGRQIVNALSTYDAERRNGGIELASNYRWETAAKEHLALYQRLSSNR